MTAEQVLTRARKLATILVTPSYRRALRHRVAASTEHHYDPLPSDLRTVLDVGANRGQFALVARERWPAARLVCFEPLPGPRASLRRALGSDAEIVASAVATTSGSAAMHVSRSDDSSSLLPITTLQSKTFGGTEEVGSIQVPTISLDDSVCEIARPALLKIDVQGSELMVLNGASRTLEAIDVVLVECSFHEFYRGQATADEVIRCLHSHGFALSAATAPTLDNHGVVLQLDLIFSRTDLDD